MSKKSKPYSPLDIECKKFENLTEMYLMPGLPILIRIDGRAFHTFTRNMPRPYCEELSNLMIDTTKYLVKETHALTGYVQSDEISLLINNEIGSEMMFGGRIQKLASVVASMASAFFNKNMACLDKYFNKEVYPCFDCRVWQVPTKNKVVSYFIWRQQDAIKNSISMAAQSKFSNKQLMKKNSNEKQVMLFQAGIDWNDYPEFFKHGTFCKNIVRKCKFTDDILSRLPSNHEAHTNSDLTFMRGVVESISQTDLTKMISAESFLFERNGIQYVS